MVWLIVGVMPVILGPVALSVGNSLGRRDDVAVGVVFAGIVCCLLAGFGLARVALSNPLGRLLVGLVVAGALAVLNLTVGLAAACGRV